MFCPVQRGSEPYTINGNMIENAVMKNSLKQVRMFFSAWEIAYPTLKDRADRTTYTSGRGGEEGEGGGGVGSYTHSDNNETIFTS